MPTNTYLNETYRWILNGKLKMQLSRQPNTLNRLIQMKCSSSKFYMIHLFELDF